MKKNFLCIEFINQDGTRNEQLSKCPASEGHVMAALQFLTKDCSITLSIAECELDENGNIVTSPFINNSDN